MKEIDIAKIIRVGRARLGINQTELARRIGTTTSQTSQWESGQKIPGGTYLIKLMETLDLVSDFFPEYSKTTPHDTLLQAQIKQHADRIARLENRLRIYDDITRQEEQYYRDPGSLPKVESSLPHATIQTPQAAPGNSGDS